MSRQFSWPIARALKERRFLDFSSSKQLFKKIKIVETCMVSRGKDLEILENVIHFFGSPFDFKKSRKIRSSSGT